MTIGEVEIQVGVGERGRGAWGAKGGNGEVWGGKGEGGAFSRRASLLGARGVRKRDERGDRGAKDMWRVSGRTGGLKTGDRNK